MRFLLNMRRMRNFIISRLKETKKTKADLARELGISWPRVNEVIKGERRVQPDEMTKFAEFMGLSVEDALKALETDGESLSNLRPMDKPFRTVKVTGSVQAGFRSAKDQQWPEDEWLTELVPPNMTGTLYGAEVHGDSMDQVYSEGDIVIFNDFNETGGDLLPGQRYVFQLKDESGDIEYTVKTLHKDTKGGYWLVAESDNPLHNNPLSVEEHIKRGELEILGRVVRRITTG